MNYYISISFSLNHYRAIDLTSIAIASEDGRNLAIHKITPRRTQKAIERFCNDGTEVKFYSYQSNFDFVAFSNLFENQLPENFPKYFRDLKFLEGYISEKVGPDFSVIEDSNYPFQAEERSLFDNSQWLKRLHTFLIQFELNLSIRQLRKKIGLDPII